jgi:hypothetical protein
MERVDKGVKLGSAVLVRSNEDEPIRFGKLVGWFDGEGKFTEAIPIVLIDGKRYFACGIVMTYRASELQAIKGLTPKQQWNALCERIYGNKDYSGKAEGNGKRS